MIKLINKHIHTKFTADRRGCDDAISQFLPITNKTVSSNPPHCECDSKQHYVIKFVSDLRQVGCFRQVLRVPLTIKLTATILLKYC